MTPEEQAQFDTLCKRVIAEKNPHVLTVLVKELNDLLEQKERRIRAAWNKDPLVVKSLK